MQVSFKNGYHAVDFPFLDSVNSIAYPNRNVKGQTDTEYTAQSYGFS